MEQLAEYLAREVDATLHQDGILAVCCTVKGDIEQALSKLDKQDLLKMLDIKECQCNDRTTVPLKIDGKIKNVSLKDIKIL